MKILNLYAGIGGNRKLWGDQHEVTAIENNPEIARAYKDFFPRDELILTDAHQYLLEHYKEFDFIWSSPPCQSHSQIRKNVAFARGQAKEVYPDMRLYQEILFLKHYFKGKWVVENVMGYYEPLIKPQRSGGHYFWSNFHISNKTRVSRAIECGRNSEYIKITGFELKGYKFGKRKDQVYHNCINSELGLHIFNCAFKIKQKTLI